MTTLYPAGRTPKLRSIFSQTAFALSYDVNERCNMPGKTSRRLFYFTCSVYIIALLTWTLVFYRNPFFKDVLFDIHLIFTSTIAGYWCIRMFLSSTILDFIKVFIRTLFRVWLLIFITFAVSRSMDRIGTLLSLTYIFGYIEGLMDINKWLESGHPFKKYLPEQLEGNKVNHAMATTCIMSIIHILCAVAVFIFYLLF
jgi:hypothetical protein